MDTTIVEADILVVDDNKENLKVISRFLKPRGYRIRIASNGEQALKIIEAKTPELLLLDIQMPKKNGFEVLQELIANKKYEGLPIILISAYSDIENKIKGFELGATDFIEKPFQMKEVIARVDYHLQTTRQKKQLRLALKKLRESQDKLIRNEKLASLGVLSAGLAHEINNPINYISAGTSSLELDVSDMFRLIEHYENYIKSGNQAAKLKEIKKFRTEIEYDHLHSNVTETMQDIQLGVKRASGIIKNLNRFSRFDSKSRTLVDINQELQSNLKILRKLSKKELEIIEEFDPKAESILAFEAEIGQVFMNLLMNAEQASPQKEKLIVRTSSKKDGIYIEIEDFGSGIPSDLMEKAFDPFQTTKNPGEGTGLGLSISHTIIKMHKGNIEFQNKKEKGTIFSIFIPKS